MDTKISLAIDSKNLEKILKQKIGILDKQLEEFKEKYVEFKYDKFGNRENKTNPYLVATYFFKSINPMGNVEPIYTSEQLAKVFDLYITIIEKVNMEIMPFQPTLTHFCNFAGISLSKFHELKNSYDESMKVLVERINNNVFDSNVTLAQHKKLADKSTTYRMKVENEMIEKKTPNVNVNVTTKSIDLDKINERLFEIQSITKRQINYEDN